MPLFKINVVNEHFTSSDEYDLPTVQVARNQAIKGALQIGAGEVGDGKPFFGAEVIVESDGERLARFIVSIGVSPLQ
ncbi:MAG: hypothetical protein ACJ8FC_07035 [Sphingomicrobium sp.]|jgi:hypothetical protein